MKRHISAAFRATRRSALVIVAGACAALVAPAALAQTEIKLGHVGEPGSLFQKSADEFAKRANLSGESQTTRSPKRRRSVMLAASAAQCGQ